MINRVALFIIFAFSCALIIDRTLTCACDEIQYQHDCEYLQCVWNIDKCFKPLATDQKDEIKCRKAGYEWNKQNFCEEFTNCSNYTASACPALPCRPIKEKCVTNYIAYNDCLNYKTKETCNSEKTNNCRWNDKNICIDKRLIQSCHEYNIYDYTSKCYIDSCNKINGQCSTKNCLEHDKQAACTGYFQNKVNKSHFQICEWVGNRCTDVINVTQLYPDSISCFEETNQQFQFSNFECVQCNSLTLNIRNKYTFSYNDDYYSAKYSYSNSTTNQNIPENTTQTQGSTSNSINSTTDQNQNATEYTAQNANQTEGGQISTNSTTQQNSSAPTNETTPGSTYSELISILILATGLIV